MPATKTKQRATLSYADPFVPFAVPTPKRTPPAVIGPDGQPLSSAPSPVGAGVGSQTDSGGSGSPTSLAAGVTKNGNQLLREKVYIIGQSGKLYGTAAEGAPAKPEMASMTPAGVTFTPASGNYDPKAEQGVQRYLTGGQLLDIPSTPLYTDPVTGETTGGDQAARPGTPTNTTAPAAASTVTGPAADQYAATLARINASKGVVSATTSDINANRGVVSAQAGTFGPQQNVINANQQVVNQQQQQNTLNRGLIGQTTAADQQRLQEQQGIVNASNNMADKVATGQSQDYRNNTDYQYGLAGLQRPTEIQTPTGGNVAGLPTGVRGQLQSGADVLTRVAGQNEQLRTATLNIARDAVNLAGTDVVAAQNKAQAAGLTLDEAKLVVSQAQNVAAGTSLDVNAAQNTVAGARVAEEKSQLAPPGEQLYTDPVTRNSQYVTPAQAAVLKAQEPVVYRAPGSDTATLTSPGQADLTKAAEPVIYASPFGGQAQTMTRAQAYVQEQEDNRQLQLADKNGGLVKYDDPKTGALSYITPWDASLKKAQTDFEMENANAQSRYGSGQMAQLDPSYIESQIRQGNISTPVDLAEAQRVLTLKLNGNAAAAAFTIKNAQASMTVENRAALYYFGMPYKDLATQLSGGDLITFNTDVQYGMSSQLQDLAAKFKYQQTLQNHLNPGGTPGPYKTTNEGSVVNGPANPATGQIGGMAPNASEPVTNYVSVTR